MSIAQAELPGGDRVTLDTPALAVMTDLTRVRAGAVAPGISLAQAEQAMIDLGVRMLFVASRMPAIEGLITTTDLRGQRALRLVHDSGRRHDELRVADVFTPLDALDGLDHDALAFASVGNLVATFKQRGRNHLLVVQSATPTTPRRVRGLFSRTQLERQLGQPIEISEIAHSFAEIESALL